MFSRKLNIPIRHSCSDASHKQDGMAHRQKPVIIDGEYRQNQNQSLQLRFTSLPESFRGTSDFQVWTELLGKPEKIHKSLIPLMRENGPIRL